MEVAKLAVLLDASEVEKQTRQMVTNLGAVGQAADSLTNHLRTTMVNVATQFQSVNNLMMGLGAQVQFTINSFAGMQHQVQQLATRFAQMGQAANTAQQQATQTAVSMNNAFSALERRLLALVSAAGLYRLGKDIIETDMAFQRIDLTLNVVTGSIAESAEQFQFLREEAFRIGVDIEDAATAFAKFEAAARGTALTTETIKRTFTAVSEAARALGLGSADVARIFLALEQMISKGVVSMEELRRQMGNALPGAFQIAARAMGMTTVELNSMVKAGELFTEDFLPSFITQLQQEIPLGAAAESTAASIGRMTTAWKEFKNAVADTGFAKLITDAMEGMAAVLRKETGGLEALNAFKATGLKQGDTEGLVADLQKRFPYSSAPRTTQRTELGIFGEKMTYETLDYLKEYQRMKEENTIMKRMVEDQDRRFWEGVGRLEEPTRPLNDEQENALEKILELREKVNAAAEYGYNREVEMIDFTTQKQIDAFDKLVKKAGESNLLARGIYPHDVIFDILGSGEDQKDNLLRRDSMKGQAEDARQLMAMFSDLERLERQIHTDDALSEHEKKVNAINERYREMHNTLVQISEYVTGADYDRVLQAVSDLESSRQDAVGRVKPSANHVLFSARTFGGLHADQQADTQAMLTTNSESEYRRLAQQIQDRDLEMHKRLRLNQAETSAAFRYGVAEMADSYGSFSERVTKVGAGLVDSLDRGFTDAFTSMIMGTKSVEEAFANMATAIVGDMVRIAVQEMLIRSVLRSAFGAFSSVGSGISGAGLAHDGAVVGANTSARANLDPLHFVNAPRFHRGGVAGGEMPIVAKQGEVIFTPEQMSVLGKTIANASESGGSKGGRVNIINAWNPNEISQHLMENPDAILNVIGKRASQVRRMISM